MRQSMRGCDRCISVDYDVQEREMFGLTEEQRQLQSAVRAFAEGEIAPHVSEWDEKSEFPHAVVKKLGEMGLLGDLS